MPLIQWIMQNLGKTFSYDGSGEILIYGTAQAGYSESFYGVPIKFSVGSKAFALDGSVWTVTGISATSSGETRYSARRGTTEQVFYDTEILVNQSRLSCLTALQRCVDRPADDLPTYEGFRIQFDSPSNQVAANCLKTLQRCLDRPYENLPTYEGIRKVRA